MRWIYLGQHTQNILQELWSQIVSEKKTTFSTTKDIRWIRCSLSQSTNVWLVTISMLNVEVFTWLSVVYQEELHLGLSVTFWLISSKHNTQHGVYDIPEQAHRTGRGTEKKICSTQKDCKYFNQLAIYAALPSIPSIELIACLHELIECILI